MKKNTLTGNPNLTPSTLKQPPSNPLNLLQQWLDLANDIDIVEPKGFVLSTISNEGKSSSRVVLLKKVDDRGIMFASSSSSQKGRDIKNTPSVSGNFWWRETIQQVSFSGKANRMPDSVSDKFFSEREREAQAITVLSKQSSEMVDEQQLRKSIKILAGANNVIERPNNWSAYHVIVDTMEFWQGDSNRFHERLRYELGNEGWLKKNLQP